MNQPLPKTHEELLALCKEKGWELEKTGSGHWKLTNPETGRYVIAASTPSDYRSCMNMRSQLRRAGLTCEPPGSGEQSAPNPEPKLITDRSKPTQAEERDFSMVNKKATGPGIFRDAIFDAMRKLGDKPKGITPGDIAARVLARFPDKDRNHINVAMAGYVVSGKLLKLGPSLYSLPPEGHVPVSTRNVAAATPEPTAPQPVDLSNLAEDFAILEGALTALASIEQVVRKHKIIAQHFAGLQALMASIKTGEG